MQLKETLGHRNRVTFSSGTEWNAQAQRQFCLSCHNNLTEVYGITVPFKQELAGIPIVGHEESNQEYCSTCHASSGSAIEAAHAPKRKPTKE